MSECPPRCAPPPPPLVHCFNTAAHRYIYDVPGNRVLRAHPSFWNAMKAAFEDAEDRTRCPRRAIALTSALRHARSTDGAFIAARPPRKHHRLRAQEIGQDLAGGKGPLVLHTTMQCNMRCTYCVYSGRYADRPKHAAETMTWDVARQAIEYYLSRFKRSDGAPPRVSFYGGEPLLEVELLERCVEHARQLAGDCAFAITTNGTLLSGEIAARLARLGFEISVSLDGPPSLHDRERVFADGSDSFHVVADNLAAMRGRFPEYYDAKVKLSAVVRDKTDLLIIAAFLEDSDIAPSKPSRFRVSLISATAAEHRAPLHRDGDMPECSEECITLVAQKGANGLSLSESLRTGWVLDRRGVARAYSRQLSVPARPSEWLHAGPCLPGTARLYVTPDGAIYPCHQSPVGPSWQIGSVWDGVSAERTAAFLNAFYDITDDLCCDCWAVRLCTLCPAAVSTEEIQGDRSDMEGVRNRCERIRTSLDYYLTLMCEILERNPRALDDFRSTPAP